MGGTEYSLPPLRVLHLMREMFLKHLIQEGSTTSGAGSQVRENSFGPPLKYCSSECKVKAKARLSKEAQAQR